MEVLLFFYHKAFKNHQIMYMKHEEQLHSQFKLSTQRFYRGTENLKTTGLGFWAESGEGIQEKINQPEQPRAFARLVVSVVCDLFCAA